MTLWSRSVKSGRVGQRCIKSSDRYKSNEHHRKSKHGAIITISIQGHNTKNQRSLNKGGKKIKKKTTPCNEDLDRSSHTSPIQ